MFSVFPSQYFLAFFFKNNSENCLLNKGFFSIRRKGRVYCKVSAAFPFIFILHARAWSPK
jgi:hypothetical protein